MKKIRLFSSDDPAKIIEQLDIDILTQYSTWLHSLPRTMHGSLAWRYQGMSVIFERSIDATAFKLRFRL